MEQSINAGNKAGPQPGTKPPHHAFPYVVLVVSLALTFFASYQAVRSGRTQDQARFASEVEQTYWQLLRRMEAYVALLRGGAAFVAGNPDLTRMEFHAYVERLRIPEFYPGLQGFGFSPRVPPEQKEAFVAEMRRQGATEFEIWPDHERDEYFTIAYLEPPDARNRKALGFDMFTEPVRRAAMATARDEARPVASGKVRLVQEIEGPEQAGFLIYLPTYQGGEVPRGEQDRRAMLTGFVYCPFRADDLFRNLYAPGTIALDLEVFDASNLSETNLLHRSLRSPPGPLPFFHERWSEIRELTVFGREWYIRFTAAPAFYIKGFTPFAVLAGGTFLSFLLFYLTLAQARARGEAERVAAQLGASERSLLEAREQLQTYASELEQRVTERTSQLRESLESLEGVLYHVAHDLRAPLRAMASFTQILAEDYPGRFDERGADYLRRIDAASRRMDELVKDLLAYGRITHMSLDIHDISLQDALNATLARLAQVINETGGQVQVEQPLPRVMANPELLRDILAELLANALKFVPSGTTPHVRIWAENGTRVRLWFEDNGIGIAPQFQNRIFRVFERLHTGDTYPGTGIGLAIVQKGVERMGGKVGVSSNPGQGSRFWIELPPPTGTPTG
jgi:signal transduction histidine kinase